MSAIGGPARVIIAVEDDQGRQGYVYGWGEVTWSYDRERDLGVYETWTHTIEWEHPPQQAERHPGRFARGELTEKRTEVRSPDIQAQVTERSEFYFGPEL